MNKKRYFCTLTKEQRDVVIDALARMRYVLPEKAEYRKKVAEVLQLFLRQTPWKG